MNALLRRYIRESLRVFLEAKDDKDDGLLVEPDDHPGEGAEENTIAAGGIVGVTVPLGAGPTYPDKPKAKKKLKKKSDNGSQSFGGGHYEDKDES
jgi:hypothetical protein